jgi:hypothetical protein
MELKKRIRVVELQAAINSLTGNSLNEEESALLTEKRAELEALRPTPPPYPRNEIDLRCSRESIAEDLQRLLNKPEAKRLLAQIEKETDADRKAMLEFEPIITRVRAAQDRLDRKNQMDAYGLWRANQEANNVG